MRPRFPILLLFALSSSVFAQNTPPPPPPYPAPISTFVGRYLDSEQLNDSQTPHRTLRARFAKVYPDHDLILMAISGSRFGAYKASTFPARAASGPFATGTFGEKYLAPDVSVEPDAAGSGWIAPVFDGQDRLMDFDVDDRGNYYLAYLVFGFGITDANGNLLAQIDPATFEADAVIAIHLGNTYYAVVSNGYSETRVYDVTNAAAPVLVRTLPFFFQNYARTTTGLALIVAPNQIQIFTPAALVAGGAPSTTLSPGGSLPDTFNDVTTDGSTLYATKYHSGAYSIAIFTPQGGNTFSETDVPVSHFVGSIDYGAGFLGVVGGTPGNVGPTLFAVNGTSLTPYDLSAYFISTYPKFYSTTRQVVPFSIGGGTYFLNEAYGLGDLFAIASAGGTALPTLSTLTLVALFTMLALIAGYQLR